MDLIQSCKFVCQSMALAVLVTLLMLLSLEWIMPGSVLPFVNLVAFVLPTTIVCLLLLVGTAWQSGAKNYINVALGLIAGLVILAFSASIVGYSSLSQLGLLCAGCLCLIAWAFIQVIDEFHN